MDNIGNNFLNTKQKKISDEKISNKVENDFLIDLKNKLNKLGVKNNIPEIKDINKDKAINSKEINIKKSSSLPSDEFSEFTFILVKNFEAKKINEEAARQKIIFI